MSAAPVLVGDVREGTGGLRVKVRVLALPTVLLAKCMLVRSGDTKLISVSTLRRAYRLVSRTCCHCDCPILPENAAVQKCPKRDGDLCEPAADKAGAS